MNLRSLWGLFKGIRPLNLSIVGLACIGFSMLLSTWNTISLILMIVPVIMVMAGGNLINDYFDLDSDKHMGRHLYTHYMTAKGLIFYYVLINVSAITIAFCNAPPVSTYSLMGVIVILFLYSRYFKRTFLLGNSIVSILCAYVPWYLYVDQYSSHNIPNRIVYIFIIYSFILFNYTLLREIIKDMQDRDGDRLLKARTIAIVFNDDQCKRLVKGIQIWNLLTHLIGWFWLLGFNDKHFLIFTVFCIIPIIMLSFKVLFRNLSSNLVRFSSLIKINIALGVLSIFFLVYF